jgi:hypothetical protein
VPLRFYRRVHVLPGVSVNVSKSGPSLSLGVRGAHVTFGRNGVTRTVGIPGTGIYYPSRAGQHTGAHYDGSLLGWAIVILAAAGLVLTALSRAR